jgi:hypothetical protein
MSGVKFKTKKRRPNYSLNYTVRRIAQVTCGLPFPDPWTTERTVDDGEWNRKEVPTDKGGTVLLSETEIPSQNTNGTWVLDRGNNWFLRPVEEKPEDDEYRYWILDYRYLTPEQQKVLEGLAMFLEWTLGE